MLTNIRFNEKAEDNFTIIRFEFDGVITPDELKTIKPPKVDGSKGVVLSGRGPIWLYCYLTHFYHPTLFIAIYDPRLNGAVVVESHSKLHLLGDIIKLNIE